MELVRKLKSVCDRLMPIVRAWYRIASGELKLSYSQYGEDAMLRGFMEKKLQDPQYKGFWVDVGAHHPVRFSNTKMFYDCGWGGVNVDASPVAIKIFEKERPRDINVNVGVGEVAGQLEYFMFSSAAENTFSREYAEKVKARGTPFLGSLKMEVVTLADLLDRYLPANQHVDFFSIDAEGLDFAILKSNDWSKYRPDFILIEIHSHGKNDLIIGGEVHKYLQAHGYEFAAQSLCTTLFKRVA